MANKKRFNFKKILRLISGIFYSILLAVILSGCSNEKVNPLGTEKTNGEPLVKEEAYAIAMDCSGKYNGEYLPETKWVSQLYPLNFTGDWKQIPNGTTKDWYMATTDEVGARVDLCATMTRCVFDFFDYEMYDNPGTIQVLLDDNVIGTYNLATTNDRGYKVLDYVVSTHKNTVATASIILLSGRMVLFGCQVNAFSPHWPVQ